MLTYSKAGLGFGMTSKITRARCLSQLFSSFNSGTKSQQPYRTVFWSFFLAQRSTYECMYQACRASGGSAPRIFVSGLLDYTRWRCCPGLLLSGTHCRNFGQECRCICTLCRHCKSAN